MKKTISWLLSGIIALNSSFAFAQSTPESRLEQLLKQDNAPVKRNIGRDVLYEQIVQSRDELDKRLTRLGEYPKEFEEIKGLVNSERYDEITPKIKSLASRLEKENIDTAQNLLREVKSFTYTQELKVEASEKEVIVLGGYTQVLVPEGIKTKRSLNLANAGPLVLLTPVALAPHLWIPILVGTGAVDAVKNKKSPKETFIVSAVMDSVSDKKEERIPAHYEEQWVYSKQETLTLPLHYKKIRVIPYSGKETAIEDFTQATAIDSDKYVEYDAQLLELLKRWENKIQNIKNNNRREKVKMDVNEQRVILCDGAIKDIQQTYKGESTIKNKLIRYFESLRNRYNQDERLVQR